MRGPRPAALFAALAAASLVAGCAPARRAPAVAAPRAPACPSTPSPVAAICARDAHVRSLRSRFRASVELDGERRDAEGVLLVQQPGAVRVKLFGLGGLTLYDALWKGGAEGLAGRVALASRDAPLDVRLAPGEAPADPRAGLSLALWALWQPRCAAPPAPDPDRPGRFALDPSSAHALRREVTLRDGVLREEELTRVAGPGGAEDRVVARYAEEDCASAGALPRRLEIEAPAQGWTATVRVLEAEENPQLDPRLFALPGAQDAGGSHSRGSH